MFRRMAGIADLLGNPEVRTALRSAWRESQPGLSGGHEEGGFIVRDTSEIPRVIRWPKGAENTIDVPPHPGCRLEEFEIVASFHTHPNTGPDYIQEPSETDRRAVRDDPNLKAPHYEGELVISSAFLYLVTPSGSVIELGTTEAILTQT